MKEEQYSTVLLYAVLVVLFTGFASGFGCDPFYFNSPISTTQSCPSNTMIIGGDPIRTQVDINTVYCGQALSTIRKGFTISATAGSSNYFQYSMWHEETDVKCTVDIGYDSSGGGTYVFLQDAGVLDQNGLANDPTSLIPFYTYKKWYTRKFSIPYQYAGRQLVLAFSCIVAPGNIGPRTFFVRDVSILEADGTTIRSSIGVTCTGASCGPACATSSGACRDIGTSMFCSCSDGWTGTNCGSAICATGCVNGGCSQPGDCVCSSGWSGTLCTVPICATGCKNGGCSSPGQCICNSGWSGALCDVPICATGCKNGGCSNPGECVCSPGWSGTLCDVPICATGCTNGGCSNPGGCDCNTGWQGSLCDAAVCSPTCNTAGATCNLPGECNCNAGWSGKDCNETICKQGCQYGTCQVAGECNCLAGWQGDLCDTFYCSSACNSQGGSCTGPNECTCNAGYSGDTCDSYCTFPKPAELAECTVIDGNSVWVVNGSLIVNSTTTVNNPVIIYGDLEVTDNGLLVVNGTTISVYGCVDIKNQSSLVVTLTPEEIEELENNGVLNRTVVTYSPLCDTANDFGIISISNPGQFPCAIVQTDQKNGPGLLSILFSLKQTCNTETPTADLIGDNTGQLLDWQLAVIIVACVVAAGAAITAGVLIRKRMLEKEMQSVGAVN